MTSKKAFCFSLRLCDPDFRFLKVLREIASVYASRLFSNFADLTCRSAGAWYVTNRIIYKHVTPTGLKLNHLFALLLLFASFATLRWKLLILLVGGLFWCQRILHFDGPTSRYLPPQVWQAKSLLFFFATLRLCGRSLLLFIIHDYFQISLI